MPTQEVACATNPAAPLCLAGFGSHAVLLDGGDHESWGTGHAIFAQQPRATLEVFASGWGRWCQNGTVSWEWGCPVTQWDSFLSTARAAASDLADPDAAGVVTVFSYDLKHWIERLARRHADPTEPVIFSAFYDWSCVTDHRNKRAWIRAQSPDEVAIRARAWESVSNTDLDLGEAGSGKYSPQPMMTETAYRQMIESALEYIAAGDVYQVNLAQRFLAPGQCTDGPALFAALRAHYPMPFSAYVDGGNWVMVSNSPECFLRVEGTSVATFPIKGTRRLSESAERNDRDLTALELANDPKERAEHVMIVDLERNDLGRVCEAGSVEVREFSTVRSYPLLHHMVSRVEGRLRSDMSLADLVRAMFPGGSVTGAPKIRAMEIIEELEPCARGLYTGVIGWSNLCGESRFNLAIRTAVLSPSGISYHAGGGIVADSDPSREYEETLLKSEAFFRTLATLR